MRVVVITPPAPVVDLARAKAHLSVDSADLDDLIKDYIAAATGHIDGPGGWLGRAIGAQTLELRADAFADPIRLPCGPVQSVTSVTYVDAQGVEQTLASSGYLLAGDNLHLAHGASWPTLRGDPEGVRIRYTAGEAAVPRAIAAAILLMTGDLFANRETSVTGTVAQAVPMSTTVENLLSPYRRWST